MSDTRLELDIKGLPQGVIPALRNAASGSGLSLTAYVRIMVVERGLALMKEPIHER